MGAGDARYDGPMSDAEETSRRRWSVALRGDDHDLERLAEHFTDGIRVARGPDGWELSADRFEETEDRIVVQESAVELVDRLRGLMVAKLASDPRLEIGPVMELLPDGSRRPHVFARAEIATARVRVYAAGVVTYPDGTVPEPPRILSWEPIIDLADRDARVRLALAFVALPPTWHRLYAGLDAVLGDRTGGGITGVVRRGATRAEVRRFNHTANNVLAIGTEARHVEPDRDPPTTPMTLTEAGDLVRRIVGAWVDELVDGGTS